MDFMFFSSRRVSWSGEQKGAWPPFILQHRIFKHFNVSSENFGVFLLEKIKVSNFIGKFMNLALLLYQYHDVSVKLKR